MEIAAPAGNLKKLKFAFQYGADVVYVGAKAFSLRARSDNFSFEELKIGINYAHALGKKVYIAVNIFFMENDIEQLPAFLDKIAPLKPDALIIADPGAIFLTRKLYPNLPVHVSTQANITNSYAVDFYKEMGVKRIVLARELSIKDIRRIKDKVQDIELEVFGHGAMCVAFSGRCLISNYLTSKGFITDEDPNLKSLQKPRSANKGDCSQSCRWHYFLEEKVRGKTALVAEELDTGTMLFSSKDLCMVGHLHDLAEAGVDSIKIEGRVKSLYYVANSVRVYRDAIRQIESGELPTSEQVESWTEELAIVTRREMATGFYYGDNKAIQPSEHNLVGRSGFKGYVLAKEGNLIKCYSKNKITKDTPLEVAGPDMKNKLIFSFVLLDQDKKEVDYVGHGVEFFLQTDDDLQPMDILRVISLD